MGFYDKCCFCIELRSGCLIIGYVSLVLEIVALIATVLLTLAGGAVMAAEQDPDSHVENNNVGLILLAISALFLVLIVFALAITIVLLVGVHQNKRGHVKAYLICSIVGQVIYFIQFVVFLAIAPVEARNVIKDLFSMALSLYFLFVIRQYYRKMDSTKRGTAIYNA